MAFRRGFQSQKGTVEDCQTLSVSELRRGGVFAEPPRPWVLTWGEAPNLHRVTVSGLQNTPYGPELHMTCAFLDASGEERSSMWDCIEVTSTPCRYGGKRFWFKCPTRSCGRRVEKLYCPYGRWAFLCRFCYNLAYEGRQEHRNKIYENVGKFTLYRRRLEKARTPRQKIKWAVKVLGAYNRMKVYLRVQNVRSRMFIDEISKGIKPNSN